MAARASEVSELKHQLDSAASEQSRLTELNTQQQSNIDALQQQLTQLNAEHKSTENQLTDSKTLISQLQASSIIFHSYCVLPSIVRYIGVIV